VSEAAPHILVVDDEVDMLTTCQKILSRCGYLVETASTSEEAESRLTAHVFHLLIADLVMPGKNGLEVAQLARRRDPQLAVLIITAHATIETALRATREGAFDYIPKPFTMEQLEVAVERALEFRRLREENTALKKQVGANPDFSHIIGSSPAMQQVFDLIGKVADTDANIVITGESGTGKELVARALHAASRRSPRRFVPVDCAALPETLLESELFGAERGAYTGAVATRAGLLEYADGGTLFLDEIANLAVSMQAKLLRVLQERVVRRLGGAREIPVDIRVVSATNQDLEHLVRGGRLREDLYYRLNVVAISTPPLRDRVGDIRLLAQHFVKEFAAREAKDVRGLSAAAMMLLEPYGWPGNVRELRNAIERAVSLTESNQVMPVDLPFYLTELSAGPLFTGKFRCAKQRAIAEFETAYLNRLLEDSGGNVSRAAARAGLKRTALHRLLTRHGLDPNAFRRASPPGEAARRQTSSPVAVV
jgi:DNA-binding NtrC family response regulator